MKTKLFPVILFILVLSLYLLPHVPKGGLGAVAVGPDHKLLVAGGDNRVLYVLDPSSLAVTKRIWQKTNIYDMAFNKNGSVLVVEDTSETLYYISTKDWQVVKTVKKAGFISPAPAADLLAGLASGYKKSTVKFLSMTDGSEKGKVEFAGKVKGIGLDAKGSRLVLVADGPKNKEAKKNKPKDLRGLEADIFKQKNDGKVFVVAEYAVPSGKPLGTREIFYTANSPVLLVDGKATYIVDYSNVNAKIVGNNVEIFKAQSSYNYGIGIALDRKAFLVGGLRSGTRVKIDGLGMNTFQVDKLPGWPEYYKDFYFAQDGTGYGVTTAYRLVKIGKDGKVLKAVPLY